MKILLINPYRDTLRYVPKEKIPYYQDTAAFGEGVNYILPLEFAYLSAILKKEKHNVFFWDAHINKTDPRDETMEQRYLWAETIIMCTTPYDMYQCCPGYVEHVNETIKAIRECGSNANIIIYGTHASQDPQSFPDADIIIQGEPERQILQAINSPKGTILKPQFFAKDELDTLPPPDWTIYDFSQYDGTHNTGFFTNPGATAAYTTNRGCFARCTFCNVFTMFPTMAYHSPERVIEDLKNLRSHGVTNIIMLDKVFTGHRPNAKKICQALIKYNIDIEYEIMARADCMDKEMAELLYMSGCKHIVLGIESASDTVLDLMQKKITWQQVQTCMDILKPYQKLGMRTDSFRVAYAPGETPQTLEETKQRFESMNWDTAPHVSTPFPNTPQWKWGIEEGKIIDRRDEGIPLDWSQTAMCAGTIKTPWTRNEILKVTQHPMIRIRRIIHFIRINGIVELCKEAYRKLRSNRWGFSI